MFGYKHHRCTGYWALVCLGVYLAAPAARAQVAISALPAASAQTGSEVLPEVQSSTTVKVTTPQLATYTLNQITSGFIGALFSGCSPSTPSLQYTGVCAALGAVASVNAGTSGTLACSPTTGTVICDTASISPYYFIGNPNSSAAKAAPISGQQAQSNLVASNFNYCAITLSAGTYYDLVPSCSSGTWGTGTAFGWLDITPPSGGVVIICGLQAGSTMQGLWISNAGAEGATGIVELVSECSADTTAANRFHGQANALLFAANKWSAFYNNAYSRWFF